MTELLTAAQMRAIEQAAIDSGEVTGLELMERAGRGVVEAILEEWPEMALTSQKAVVLCGPGNNGGDGFVVARLLKDRGWEVEVFLYGEVGKLPPDAKVNAERWLDMGEIIDITSMPHPEPGITPSEKSIAEYAKAYELLFQANIVIDGLFGTGFAGHRSGDWDIVNFASHSCIEDMPYAVPFDLGTRWVAIDLPSGSCSDSGRRISAGEDVRYGLDLKAHMTVTFHRAKLGHVLAWGEYYCRHVVVKDIGLSDFGDQFADSPHLRDKSITQKISGPERHFILNDFDVIKGRFEGGHKYSHGHALILSGPAHFTGASRLAARGALRIGAGLVTIGAEPAAMTEHAAQLTSIMLTELPDAVALTEKLRDKRINALCLGPGLGVDDRGKSLVEVAVRGDHAPYGTVLDADAITILAQEPELFAALHDKCVLTPHAGEFARLFPDIAAELAEPATTGPAYSKVDAARDAAKRAGCVVLFKGADTVIADQTGRAAISSAHYERSAPWLATAGSGDVLAGFITGLMARGFAPMQAAETAAWLHVECALKFGPGLIAEDIPEQLPAVFRDLGL